ncbi:PAS domain S-box-containing protein [Pseudorhizobium tarimense]|uniref:histidine kinase n=1 Tax=Pseudorhizobium tarimense TaxID=1079109 RepID=A0ABV2HD30_9HYPH|nr:PAS domain S-box protein [Pseudorhizobium tarimense]MCJ8521466.1 PAS domain S-box protein [Pseudorhizobium tarimense]
MALHEFDFLAADGELATLMKEINWASTTLGAPRQWHPSLKMAVAMILKSPVPMATMWGDDGVMVYNDAYAAIAGTRHPGLLGAKVRDAWPEAADFNQHVMTTVLGGGTLSYREQHLTLHRQGHDVDACFDLDYSPIPDENGRPLGVLAIVIETTDKVRSERWRTSELARLRAMFEQAPGFVSLMRGQDHVFELVNEAYLRLVGFRDVIGKTAREAHPDLEGQGFFDMLDQVFSTGTPFIGTALPITFNEPDGAEDKFIDLIYQAVRDPEGKITGVFAQGHDVTDRVLAEKALKAGERQSRQIFDGAVDYVILSLDLDGRIQRWNEGARRIFGWGEDEIRGQHWDILFTPEDRSAGASSQAMDAALKAGTAHHDRWHVRKCGERFWASGSISSLVDEQGQPAGFVKVLRDRTEEHLAAAALNEAEARLRRAQEAGGVGVFSLDLNTNILSPSPEFCKIFGLQPVDAISVEDVQTLIFPEDFRVASDPDSRRAGTAPLDVEYRIRRAGDGEERLIARRGEYDYGPEGRPIRLAGVIQDVTEKYKAQRDLRESEERFGALAQALPNHVWTARANGELDWFNERVHDYSGKSYDELHGNGWVSMVHPEDLPEAAARWESALSSGETYEAEFRLRQANGSYRWHIARAVPVKDERGQILRWIGTNTDIEEQRETRAKLEELNKTLQQRVAERTADRDRMWRLSTDIMLVADFDATIVAVNPAWGAIFGWEEDELIGLSFMNLVHPDDVAATLVEVGKLSEGVTTFSFENRYQTRHGTYRTISWTAVPDDAFIHAVGRDVTEERAAAEALRKTEAALQQAQKMESIGNLTGGVAHDFNNLLQVVAGNLQLLAADITGNEKAQRRIANALAGVDRGSKLASQLLAFGRRQALDPRVVNIGRLIGGMDEMLRRTIGEGIEVESIVSGGLWNTLVDPTQIENALLNLAINARDAMDGFGKLTIEVGNAYLDDVYARSHEDVVPGQYVALSVTDTGTGMSPEIVAKVFEPFFSTKPDGKGTGLGLSMVYGFVKQSGGHVKIYSELGQGTTVKVYLPRSMEQEDIQVDHGEERVQGGQETILVAEDDDAVRATVVEMLQDLGYRVLKAPDASAALSIIESGIAIDMLFTDVVMPGPLKSPELARKAKERLPNIGILFTSGYTENSIVHGGRLDPGVQLLSKPYTREALARKIRHVLANEEQVATAVKQLARVEARPPQQRSAHLKVLLVEDDVLIRMGTADMLTELQYEALEAGSAEEALDLLQNEQVDIVVSDLGLPGLSGEELCREIRRRWPQIGIVVATGANKAPVLDDPRRTALLPKPHGVDELRQALEAVVPDAQSRDGLERR